MDNFALLMDTLWESFLLYLPRAIYALLLLLLFIFLGKWIANGVGSVMKRVSQTQIHDAFFRSLIRLVFLYFGVVLALNALGLEKLSLSILAGGGVTAIVLGFAFREIGENFLAGIFLAFSRPFNVGDLVHSEGLEGRVKAIALRFTHLRADDGRDIFVPSSQLFSQPVINYTRDGMRRHEFSVGIDYANDAAKACTQLLETISGITGVLGDPKPSVTINALEPGYVELKGYYWRDLFDSRIDGRQLRINVLDACRKMLLENGYTVSADTTSNVAVSGSLANG